MIAHGRHGDRQGVRALAATSTSDLISAPDALDIERSRDTTQCIA
jgi:hypothetical protein